MGHGVRGDYRAEVPDNDDYEHLAQLLADPSGWTPEDAAVMRSALANQRDAVAASHPKDVLRQRQMTTVADEIEAAIRQYDDTR